MPDFLKDNSFIVWLAALGTAVAAFRSQFMSLLSVFKSLFIVNITLKDNISCIVLCEYLQSEAKVYGLRSYSFDIPYIPSENGRRLKIYSNLGGNCMALLGRVPIFVQVNESKHEMSGAGGNMYCINISFVRGTISAEEILKKLEAFANNVAWKADFKIIRLYGQRKTSGYSRSPGDELQPFNMNSLKRPLYNERCLSTSQRLSMTTEVEKAMKEAEMWFASKEWFRQRLIPWKRGWLLEGPPGTGKSTLAKAVAEKMNVPLVIMDIGSMSNSEFITSWESLCHYTPCVVLIEDIDSSFHGRKNVTAGELGEKLSFDCLINTIDGVQSVDGVFLIVTTNDISKIDPALASDDEISSRPGRIDRVIHMNGLDKQGYEKMAARILGKQAVEDNAIEDAVHGNISPAKFQEICIRKALKEFYSEDTNN